MATLKSSEMSTVTAVGNSKINPNQLGGRVRMAEFSFTAANPSNVAEGDVILLTKLPKPARIIGIEARVSALGTNQVVNFGLQGADGSGFYTNTATADDGDFIVDADTTGAAGGNITSADITTAAYLYELSKECYLTCTAEDTVGSTGWANSSTLNGYILYAVD